MRLEGFEPPHPKVLDSKSRASADSATSAVHAPRENRTPISALRGLRPKPLDDRGIVNVDITPLTPVHPGGPDVAQTGITTSIPWLSVKDRVWTSLRSSQ